MEDNKIDQLVGDPAAKAGRALKLFREEQNLTQRNVVNKADNILSDTVLCHIEKGMNNPRINDLYELFKALGYKMELKITELPKERDLRTLII